LKVYNQILGI